MNPSTGGHPIRSRRFLKRGLAVVAVGLVANLALILNREAPPPPVPIQAPTRELSVQISEGQPMRIAADELARAGQERKDNGLGMTFCWCPPGEFSMGGGPKSASGRYLDGASVRVSLSRGFWMGKFEVTQAQWQRVMGRNLREQRFMDPTQPRPLGDESRREHAGMGPDHPIYFTSHDEAQEFCFRLTDAERKAGRLESAWVYTLPTEAQWEFACRAGTMTATAFGDRLGSAQANFDGTVPFNKAPAGPFLRETTPVGTYPANSWGLHDMHGNVWEWCLDGFEATLVGGADPFVGQSPRGRTMRGGCWHNQGHLCLSTTRFPMPVDGRGSGLGFRVALVSAEPSEGAKTGIEVPASQPIETREER